MNETLAMGGYGIYVWSSFALFGAALLWDLLMPRLRERALLRAVRARARREAARAAT